MAEKSFGVKEVNLIGASGTPSITSPNNLNLNAVNVAISTNVSIGGTLSVTGNVSVGGTLTYEDVTNIDSVGVVTARNGIVVQDDATFQTANTKNVVLDKSDNSLTFGHGVKANFGDSKELKIYHESNVSRIQSDNDILYLKGTDINFYKGNSSELFAKFISDGAVELYHNGTKRLETSSVGVSIPQDIDVDGHTNLDNVSVAGVSTFTGTINANGGLVGNATKITLNSSTTNSSFPVLFSTGVIGSSGADTLINSSKLTFNPSSGTLAATSFSGSGASLTGIAVTEAPVTDYTITGDGSHYYFHGGGVDETAGDPDLYLIRGQKYRFNNTTGSSHPFEFRAATNGSAYTNGVTGDDEGVQFFTVPYDAPARIYYICTVHSGMVGNIYIRGAGGQNDNVGITTFSGFTHIKTAVNNTAYQTIESTASNSYPYLRLKNDAREYQLTCHGGLSDAFTIYDGTSAAHRFAIDSTGKVGINETSPQQQLHVHDDTNYEGILINGNGAPRIAFARSTTTTGEWSAGIDGTNGNNFVINNSNDNSNRKLIISSSGVTASGTLTSGGNATFNGVVTFNGNYQQGNASQGLALYGSSASSRGVVLSHGNNDFRPTHTNAVDLGTSSIRWKQIYTNNSVNTSDKNLKNTILDSDLGLSFINKLRPVSYKWNQKEEENLDTKTHYGLIAQEIETALISEGKTLNDFAGVFKPDDYKDDGTGGAMGISLGEIISPLIKAVQELSAKVAALEGS